ncbi:MAG: hypothetical protein H7841_13390 [Magnetospirillum sp. WYHS-4]
MDVAEIAQVVATFVENGLLFFGIARIGSGSIAQYRQVVEDLLLLNIASLIVAFFLDQVVAFLVSHHTPLTCTPKPKGGIKPAPIKGTLPIPFILAFATRQ